MSSSSIEAGEAWISISVKNEKLKQGLYEASKKIAGFSNEMREAEKKIAPTVSVKGIDRTLRLLDRFRQKTAEIGQGIQNDFFEDMLAIKGIFWAISTSIHAAADALGGFGDQFNKMSGRTGFGTGFLSEYAYVAKMSGSSAEALENAIRKTQRLIGEASESSVQKLAKIGLTLAELQVLTPEQQFERVMSAIASIEDPARRSAAAMSLWKDAGTGLLPMLENGTEGIAKMREEARQLGVSITDADAVNAANYADAMDRVQLAIKGVQLAFGKVFNKFLTNIGNGLAWFLGKFANFIDKHRMLAGVIASLTGVFTAFAALALSYQTIMTTFLGTAAKLGTAFSSLSKVMAALWGVMAAHPIGALITALSLLVVGTAWVSGAFKSHTAEIKTAAEDLRNSLEQGIDKDKNVFAQIQQLASKQSLTNSEFATARQLIGDLVAKYGDFGVSVDEATRSIRLEADALERLNEAQRAKVIAEQKNVVAEKKHNLLSLKNERKYIEDTGGRTWTEWLNARREDDPWVYYRLSNFRGAHYQEKMEDVNRRINAMLESIQSEERYLESLEAGGEIKGSMAAVDVITAVTEGGDIEKEVSRYLDDYRRSTQTSLENELTDIDRRAEELQRKIIEAVGGVDNLALEQNRQYQDMLNQVIIVAGKQKAAALEADAQKTAEANRAAAEESQRAWQDAYESITRQEKLWEDGQKSELQRRIDRIHQETDAYRQQLVTLRDLELAKGDAGNKDVITHAERKFQESFTFQQARINQEIEEWNKKSGSMYDAKILEKQSELGDVYRQIHSGDPSEDLTARLNQIKLEITGLENEKVFADLAESQTRLNTAFEQLRTAEEKGDPLLVSIARERLADVSGDYIQALKDLENRMQQGETPAEILGTEIEEGMENSLKIASSGGTFSLFDTQKLDSNDYQRKIADSTSEIVWLMREMSRKQFIARKIMEEANGQED